MTNSLQRLSLWLCFSLSALLLAGCSTTRVVESEVSSFSTLSALPAPPTYRLERLPSQQAQAVQFATIEAQAQQALARVGLQRDDANAKLVLQLGVQGGMVPNPYWSGYPRAYPFGGPWPYGRWGWSVGYGRGWGGGMGMGMGMGGMGEMTNPSMGNMPFSKKNTALTYFKNRALSLILLMVCIGVLASSILTDSGINLAELVMKILSFVNQGLEDKISTILFGLF